MNQALQEQYESLYAKDENAFGEGLPSETVKLVVDFIESGNIIDVGGGQGRNAIYLAEQGFAVTVIDFSTISTKQVLKKATDHKLPLTAVTADITKPEVFGDTQYEVVVCTNTLHHLTENEAFSLLKRAQEHTRPGGLHIIETFGDEGALASKARGKGRYYPTLEELAELYSDWEILTLTASESIVKRKDKAGNHLTNQLLMLAARKPT